MTFLAPWALAGLLLLPLVWWLARRRPAPRRGRVLSVALWEEALSRAPAAATLVRRHRPARRDLLPVLAVGTCVLGAAGPALPTGGAQARRLALVADRSASMQAAAASGAAVGASVSSRVSALLSSFGPADRVDRFVAADRDAAAGESDPLTDRLRALPAGAYDQILLASDHAPRGHRPDRRLALVIEPPAHPNAGIVGLSSRPLPGGDHAVWARLHLPRARRAAAGRWTLTARVGARPIHEAHGVIGDDAAPVVRFRVAAGAWPAVGEDEPPLDLSLRLTGARDGFAADDRTRLLPAAAALRVAYDARLGPSLRAALRASGAEPVALDPHVPIDPAATDLACVLDDVPVPPSLPRFVVARGRGAGPRAGRLRPTGLPGFGHTDPSAVRLGAPPAPAPPALEAIIVDAEGRPVLARGLPGTDHARTIWLGVAPGSPDVAGGWTADASFPVLVAEALRYLVPRESARARGLLSARESGEADGPRRARAAAAKLAPRRPGALRLGPWLLAVAGLLGLAPWLGSQRRQAR